MRERFGWLPGGAASGPEGFRGVRDGQESNQV
jgi:hypothetical protein